MTLLALVISASNAFATTQYPDNIYYGGTKYDLQTNPMELYFSKRPDKRPGVESTSTALHRGYVATFEIKDNDLILSDIEIELPPEIKDRRPIFRWKSVKTDIVPKDENLQMDWYTGILVLTYGAHVGYEFIGFQRTYSNYILLEIKNGTLTGEKKLDFNQYEQFKEKQFHEFKKTQEYEQIAENCRKAGHKQEFIDRYLQCFVAYFTSRFLEGGGQANEPAGEGLK